MLLAIDSATQRLSLALHDGRELLAEQGWRSVNRHSAELPPAVERMLADAAGELSALAVASGPGSFTGLRVGVAFAQGLAAARGLPLVGVHTGDILAAAQGPCPGYALLVMLAAGRGRSIAICYHWQEGRWQAADEARLFTPDALARSLSTPTLVAGELGAADHAALTRAQQDGAPLRIASPASSLRRAGYLAQVALEQLQRGAAEDFAPERIRLQYITTQGTS